MLKFLILVAIAALQVQAESAKQLSTDSQIKAFFDSNSKAIVELKCKRKWLRQVISII